MSLNATTEVAARGAVVDHVDRMFRAVEAGDMPRFRDCFAPGALVWHNVDDADQEVDAVVTAIGGLCAISTGRCYQDARIVAAGDLRFVQHVLTASLASGRRLRLPAMMRIALAQDGRIARIEEYFDSRAIDILATP